MKKFDSKAIEKQILSLIQSGYVIELVRSSDDGSYYYKIQHPEDIDNDCGVGIGYKAVSDEGDYFYHNSHGKNDNNLGNVWNHSGDKRGPAGWYTFDQTYIEDIIKKKKQNPIVAIKKKFTISEQIPAIVTHKYEIEAESEEEAMEMIMNGEVKPYDSITETIYTNSIELEFTREVIREKDIYK
jgi:hypothetical protein